MPSDANAALAAQIPANSAASKKARLDDLARRYYSPLLSFFRKRTRNAPEVHDLVQQVFLRLAQHGEPSRIENPDGYIFRTAANTLKDHYRHEIVRERCGFHACRPVIPADAGPAFQGMAGRV